MTCSDDHNRNELTDAQLDALMSAADVELLAYARANTHPRTILTAFMGPIFPSPSSVITGIQKQRNATRSLAVALLSARLNCDAYIHTVNSIASGPSMNIARELAGNLDRAHRLAHDSTLNLARDPGRDLDLALALTLARNRARHLVLHLARDLIRARDRDRALSLARELNRALARALDAHGFQLDVSDTDLSALPVKDLDQLRGVVWNEKTRWPQNIAGRVREGSREVRPGVYQVRGGNEHEDMEVWV